jgi:hypothetical protein
MKLFKSKPKELKGSSIPRVAKMSEHDLVVWMDSLIMQLGSAYDVWRDHDELPDEVDKCLEAISELWSEIKVRRDGRPSS